MASSNPTFNGEIFRKDWPMVIASNRGSAILQPVRLAYKSAGYTAGQVLARNTTSLMYEPYVNSGASGTGTAQCVLFDSHGPEDFTNTSATGATMATGIFAGCVLYTDKLISYDATAKTNMNARDIVDATGVNLTIF